MPALSSETLLAKVRAVLPAEAVVRTDPADVRPIILDLPGVGPFRLYVWTLTEDRSREGRPPGEFKIQLILPGQGKGERGSLDLRDMPTGLLGYSPDHGVFVGWEARLYIDFGYSANVQVRDDLLVEARESGWAVAPPRTSQGHEEVRVAFAPAHLPHYLGASADADDQGYEGVRREAFLLSHSPGGDLAPSPAEAGMVPGYIEEARRRITVVRTQRSPLFARGVKIEYDYACAVCLAQMGIVEAAHIVPVSEGGSDDLWNGIALCPNHHRLFDCRLFVVDPELIVRIDHPRVEFLVDCERDSGLEILRDHDGEAVLKPVFWDEDEDRRLRMQAALEEVLARAAVAR